MKTETFIITGTSHYENNIMALMVPNEDFKLSKKDLLELYQPYDIVTEYYCTNDHVVLEPEPDNQYDPNAIRVEIFNSTVGYIKRASCTHVKNLLKNYKIVDIKATEVQVGKFKKIYEDSVETNTFKGPFIRIAISYIDPEEEVQKEEAAKVSGVPKAPETPKEEKPDRAGKVKRMKRSLIIVAALAWIVLSILCHFIEPALILGIVFIIIVSEIFKRLK